MLPDRTHQHDCAAADDGPIPQDPEPDYAALEEKVRLMQSGNTAIMPNGEIVARGTPGSQDYESPQKAIDDIRERGPVDKNFRALTVEELKARYTASEIKAELRRRGYKIPRGPAFMKAKRRKK